MADKSACRLAFDDFADYQITLQRNASDELGSRNSIVTAPAGWHCCPSHEYCRNRVKLLIYTKMKREHAWIFICYTVLSFKHLLHICYKIVEMIRKT